METQAELASMEVAYEVEQFYYREAQLQNQRRQREWLENPV